MSQQAIKDNILRLLEEIVNRTQRVAGDHPPKDLSFEIDLIRDDLRVLYRHLETFARQDEPTKTPEREPVDVPESGAPVQATTQEREEAPGADKAPVCDEESVREEAPGAEEVPARDEAPAPEEEPDGSTTPPDPAGPAASEPAGSEDAKAHEEPPRPDQEKPKTNNGVKAVIDILSEYSNRTIGDQYLKEEDDSLHQRIAGSKEDKSIGTRMQQHPISNLKEAIGVNEKFLFINELFGGNIEDYRDAIARLNEMETMKAAFDYLNQLGREYAWDGTRSVTTIEKLANLVQRRHMDKSNR